jgi:hypothetical protein
VCRTSELTHATVEIRSRRGSDQILHGDDVPFGKNSDREHTVSFAVKV